MSILSRSHRQGTRGLAKATLTIAGWSGGMIPDARFQAHQTICTATFLFFASCSDMAVANGKQVMSRNLLVS